MSRETWVWDPIKQAVVPKHEKTPTDGTFHVISDGLDYVVNPADGKRYTSKRAYYAAVRAHGCEIVGNENTASVERNRPKLDRPAHELKRVLESYGL